MMRNLPSEATMWRAFTARDREFDGLFYVAVKTTGVCCRPSCPARRPRRENVRFFARLDQATSAGYRPCKRCEPERADGSLPDWAASLIHRLERFPGQRIDDADLEKFGIDPVLVRRFFRRTFGMTFHEFERRLRLSHAAGRMKKGETERAGWDADFKSASGFRDAFRRLFGSAPTKRAAESIVVDWMPSPVGPLVLGGIGDELCLLEFSETNRLETQLQSIQKRTGRVVVPGKHPAAAQSRQELAEYFAGDRSRFDVPIRLHGTAFQTAVWRGLLEIPYGRTESYESLARKIGQPGKQRAVGRANGQNCIAIIIPCHRVVNKSGALGGYGGGLWRKQWLLNLEKQCGSSSPMSDSP